MRCITENEIGNSSVRDLDQLSNFFDYLKNSDSEPEPSDHSEEIEVHRGWSVVCSICEWIAQKCYRMTKFAESISEIADRACSYTWRRAHREKLNQN